jgi:hypothetical protein
MPLIPSIVSHAPLPRQCASSGNEKCAALSHSVRESLDLGGKGRMAQQLCEFGDFIRKLRIRARFGELSRAPLQLLRLELRADVGECEWIARPSDQWDAELPSAVGERNASLQALHDAIAVRDLLFRLLPNLSNAVVRVYRRSQNGDTELIIMGALSREQHPPLAVRSLVMRAKLFGFRFSLEGEILRNLQLEECAVNS